jgi:vancomycin resistance protein YoaR
MSILMKLCKKKIFIVIMTVLLAITAVSCASGRTVKDNVYLEGKDVGGMDEKELLQVITEYANKIDVEPVQTGLDTDKWEIVEGKPGRKVNVDKTLEAVLSADEGERVKLLIDESSLPQVVLEPVNNVAEMGSYTSELLNKDPSRINNIKQAQEVLDYIKIQPGEEFSFNGALGKRTTSKGYKPAPIIVQTEDGPGSEYGVGGGICQVSSTLYNAVDSAGLEVTERHPHSRQVKYVPEGRDATVVYGGADLKFKNNKDYPVMIRVYVEEDSLTVKIMGKAD